MSQGIAHFALGAALTALVVAFLLPFVPYPRTVTLAGGGWALVPDAPHLVESPTMEALHDSAWADLFWFHRALDRWDVSDSTEVAALFVAALLFATLVAEYRTYRWQTRHRRRSHVDETPQ
ncbi:hypothetical protein ACFO0N_06225 [Halobium salinum]|uniref:DUF1461 domain-containing protein n=1 Tax=Halobium salinum TaxID=1364940 RepID=A0ABD5P9F2_9EURY|nr:hypothetical protein [Halobium salinum]